MFYNNNIEKQSTKMNRLFGAKKQQAPKVQPPKEEKKEEPEIKLPQKPKPTLTQQQSRLQNKTRELSQTITRLDAEAKQLLQKSKKSKGSAKEMYKQRCVMVLKKRKQYENQLKNYMTHQFTLNQVAFTSENIQNTLEMGQTMQEVLDQQKQVMKNLDLDKLDDIRDQMVDMKYESDYMNEMLNRDYDIDIDEDDLDDELGELERELKVEKQQKNKGQIQNNQQMAI